MAQLVEALRYNLEGCGFDSRWCRWNFHWCISSRTMALGSTPGDKGGRCVELKTIPPSCADCLEIWELQAPETLRACPGLYRDCFTFAYMTLTFLQIFQAELHTYFSLSVQYDRPLNFLWFGQPHASTASAIYWGSIWLGWYLPS